VDRDFSPVNVLSFNSEERIKYGDRVHELVRFESFVKGGTVVAVDPHRVLREGLESSGVHFHVTNLASELFPSILQLCTSKGWILMLKSASKTELQEFLAV
jgi:hypothetical protein